MRSVTVRYHNEPEGWWAETDDLPNYSAAGASFEEVRRLVRLGLPDLLGDEVDFYDDVSETGIASPMIVHVTGPTLAEVNSAVTDESRNETLVLR